MINLDLPRYLVLLYMPASTRKPTKTKEKMVEESASVFLKLSTSLWSEAVGPV